MRERAHERGFLEPAQHCVILESSPDLSGFVVAGAASPAYANATAGLAFSDLEHLRRNIACDCRVGFMQNALPMLEHCMIEPLLCWSRPLRRLLLGLAVVATFGATGATAGVIYIDSRIGNDRNTGRSATITGLDEGPVRSLEAAARVLRAGDVVEIANHGDPYFGSLTLAGVRGLPTVPLVVNGHGAVLDGSEPIVSTAWEPLSADLWRLVPEQKAWYGLVRDEAAVPEVAAVPDASQPPTLPAAHWTVWHGAIYYQAEPDELPPLEPFRLANRNAGLFLYDARLVIVRNLTLRHYRLDGVHVADRCRDVLLEGITSEHNGRSGIFVGGSSRVLIRGGSTTGNRDASLLLRGLGTAEVEGTAFDTAPVQVK